MINKKVVLFDGVCNLCNSSVDFIIKHDKKDIYMFASLQSEAGERLLKKFTLDTYSQQTVILVENKKYHTRSSAVLRICRDLEFPYNLLYGFIIIPKSIRNYFYDFIGKRRIKWFGKKETCRIPTEKEKSKFL